MLIEQKEKEAKESKGSSDSKGSHNITSKNTPSTIKKQF